MYQERLQKIYLEAGRLFNKKGYANTKMAEIAKASGIAVGTMYSMFSGKDAVLSFVLYTSFHKEYLEGTLHFPLQPIPTSVLMQELQAVLDYAFAQVLCIQDEQGNIVKPFIQLISELFDLLADYLLALDNIEGNGDVLSELSSLYLPRKKQYLNDLADYLRQYSEIKQIRVVGNYVPHAHFITNTLTWWALNSNLMIPTEPILRSEAKAICIGVLERAYQY
ncbi:MAG: TetR/AcrR family transcriptional regulator [Erysipelotrichaceae bacterium]|nr:TetR/AcrR family transcriptional regulator [Erysipelotrichaceae bacterium]